MTKPPYTATILFDGVCNLCNRSVQFIIQRDPAKQFKFASLQSPVGQALLQEYHLPTTIPDTIVLIEDGQAYTRSTAALHIARRLSKRWPMLYALRVIPAPIRDFVYTLVATYRYTLFGRHDMCMLRTAETEERFLS